LRVPRRFLLAVLGLFFLLAWALYHLTMRGIIFPSIQQDPLAERYAADLEEASPRMTTGVAISPDGRFLAIDTAAARSYHTINVWDRWTERIVPVLSIQEIDPGSGTSHRYTWSVDSRALLISGSGSLPFRPPGALCFVYLPKKAILHEVAPCE